MRLGKLCFVLTIVAVGIGAAFYRMGTGLGCGPFFDTAFFTYTLHPDFPLEPYARGELGVIQPTYARSYLYVAYRYLSGKIFDTGEQKELVEFWNARLGPYSLDSSQSTGARRQDPTKEWIEARKKVSGAPPPPSIEVFRDFGKSYQQYFNCADDGFKTAISTLNERIAKFGADNQVVRDWLTAQDQVFANCNGKPPGFRPQNENAILVETIPGVLQSGAPPLARADRDYQIAAAYFYSANFDEAVKRFQTIGRDANSPWRQISMLLAARCLIRKATLSSDEGAFDAATLTRAEDALNQILSDPGMRGLHPSAQRLHDFVEVRIHPQETERKLAANLLQEHVHCSLKQSLWDYTMLMDKAGAAEEAKSAKVRARSPQSGSSDTHDLQAGDDLTDWLGSFQDTSEAGLAHALERWTATRSIPWLVASIAKVHAGGANVSELLKAAETVPPTSPAFATIAFHRLRLLSGAHKNDEVRASLDNLLSERSKSLPRSSLNLFLALRMRVATNLDELLKFAQRVPATVTMDEEGMELPEEPEDSPPGNKSLAKGQVRFDIDSTEILNKMLPLNILSQVAEDKILTEDLRRQIAQAVWVRAILSGDAAEAQRITPVWESLEAGVRNDLEAYRGEKSPESAHFAAIYFMLKFPGTRPIVDNGVGRETALNKIDDFRDNWWCLPEPNPTKGSPEALAELNPIKGPLRSVYPGGEPPNPAFLSAEQKAMADDNWRKLARVAPNYFAREVLAWGKQHPDDPREAEALYLVIRATRYGCTDAATAGLSKAAFEFLHSQYPKTEWARKTKYWYGSNAGG
ncbi:MAG TPA: hypothetical protein VKV95_14060 [Terriglobia bacterium]|nr:hypothetical protein [Terriglobia bacterium]